MIQLLISGSPRSVPILRDLFICDPEALVHISKQFEDSDSPPRESGDRFSLILHDLRVGGAWKRTNRGRLPQTHKMLCAYVVPELREKLTFLDLGASDGITTLEALSALRTEFGEHVKALLADINVSLMRYSRGFIVEYRAPDGEPVMVRLGRLAIRLARARHDQPRRSWLVERYLGLERFRRSLQAGEAVPLIHPLVRKESGISVLELNCLVRSEALKESVGAIRGSNVLNLGYFTPTQLNQAVSHIHFYLQQRGCLVISRNRDQPNGESENGSVWLKDHDRFCWVADFGDGSEIKSIVNSWRRTEV